MLSSDVRRNEHHDHRAHKGRPIKLLIADQDICIIDLENDQLIRELTLDPKRDHQPIRQA